MRAQLSRMACVSAIDRIDGTVSECVRTSYGSVLRANSSEHTLTSTDTKPSKQTDERDRERERKMEINVGTYLRISMRKIQRDDC